MKYIYYTRTLLLSAVFSIISSQLGAQTFATAGSTQAINCLTHFNGDIYAGGGNGMGYLVKWNGTAWDSVDLGMPLIGYAPFPYTGTALCALAEYNGFLYLGGRFDSGPGHPWEYNIRKWDGTTWSAVSWGIGDPGGTNYFSVKALAVYNGELYVAGCFTKAGGIPVANIAKWNGVSWSSIGGVSPTVPGAGVNALQVHNGALYVAGFFNAVAGPGGAAWSPAENIAKWDGTSWSALGAGTNNPIFALTSHNGDLYAGGCFDSAGTVAASHVAKWDGSSWTSLGSGVDDPSPQLSVRSLASYDGALYASGKFTVADGQPANNIAKWNVSSWSSVGSGLNGGVSSFLNHNTELYLGGVFSTAGGVPVTNAARLVPCTNAPAKPSPVSGSSTPCTNTTTVYSVPHVTGEVYTYTWTLPSGWSGSASGNSISVMAGSTGGNIAVTAFNSCGTSTTQTLAVNPLPVTPITITQAGNVLTAPPGLISYQWHADTGLIAGAISQTYIVPQDGNYYVIGTETNGCVTQSNTVSILLGIGSSVPTLAGIQLYPNPNNGIFTMKGSASANEHLRFEVRDVTGRLITSGALEAENNSFSKQIELRNAAPGMYVLRLTSVNGRSSYPFVVE